MPFTVRPGESRYRTSVYYVRERPEYNEYKVTATLDDDGERWIIMCHGCPQCVNLICTHANYIRDALAGVIPK